MERSDPYSLLARDYDRELGVIFEVFQLPVLERVLERWVPPPPGPRVLDLACGTGRVAVFLAGRGFEVTGLDRSAAMLEVARRRPGAESVRWLRDDMTAFDLASRFHLVTCNFDSLNHLLHPEQVRSTFARVALHLLPGGCFVFDVNTRYALEHHWPQMSRVIEERDYFAIWRGRYDPTRERALMIADYFVRDEETPAGGDLAAMSAPGPGPGPGYRLVREVHRQRAYDDDDLRIWLSSIDLQVCATRSDGAWALPGRTTGRVAYVSRKAAALA